MAGLVVRPPCNPKAAVFQAVPARLQPDKYTFLEKEILVPLPPTDTLGKTKSPVPLPPTLLLTPGVKVMRWVLLLFGLQLKSTVLLLLQVRFPFIVKLPAVSKVVAPILLENTMSFTKAILLLLLPAVINLAADVVKVRLAWFVNVPELFTKFRHTALSANSSAFPFSNTECVVLWVVDVPKARLPAKTLRLFMVKVRGE